MLKALAAAALGLMLAACQPQARALQPQEGDASIGAAAGAKVTIIEFGAPTCPGCKAWHDENWSRLKPAYVDNKKIRFVWRELPSHNPPVDVAIFGIGRCVGGEGFFEVMDEAFARQTEIEMASRQGDARAALISLGKKFSLNEEKVRTCTADPRLIARIDEVVADATARRVEFTPTLFINDVKVDDASFENMSKLIDAALGAP